MARAKPKPKSVKRVKRQPDKKRLPSSYARKKTAVSTKSKESAVKKGGEKRRSSLKQKRRNSTKKINIRFSRSRRLTLSFKITKTIPKKKRKSARKKRNLSFQENIIFSMILIAVGLYGIVHSVSMLTGSSSAINGRVSAQSAFSLDSVDPLLAPQKIFLPRSIPTNIKIPAVGIDVPLVTAGKHPDGTLAVPDNLKVAGWYRYSPTPGELGPSVIAGHVNDIRGPGVFGRLYLVKEGQIVEIRREDGTKVKFKVYAIKQFSQNESFPTQLVYGNTPYAGLRIITCGGNFNYLTRHYSDNTVIFASIIRT